MSHHQYTHNGMPETSDLTGWVEWAEDVDPDRDSNVWDKSLVSVDYVMKLLQQIREMKIDTEKFCDLLKNPIKDPTSDVVDQDGEVHEE